jgi:predicted Zn-dependent protease
VYRAGYAPPALIDILEKLEALERRKPGAMSRLFRSHPAISQRIAQTQKHVQELLKQQPQYLVTTSEFRDVQARLQSQFSLRTADPKSGGPTLRRPPGERRDPVEDRDSRDADDAERPTPKRSPSMYQPLPAPV